MHTCTHISAQTWRNNVQACSLITSRALRTPTHHAHTIIILTQLQYSRITSKALRTHAHHGAHNHNTQHHKQRSAHTCAPWRKMTILCITSRAPYTPVHLGAQSKYSASQAELRIHLCTLAHNQNTPALGTGHTSVTDEPLLELLPARPDLLPLTAADSWALTPVRRRKALASSAFWLRARASRSASLSWLASSSSYTATPALQAVWHTSNIFGARTCVLTQVREAWPAP